MGRRGLRPGARARGQGKCLTLHTRAIPRSFSGGMCLSLKTCMKTFAVTDVKRGPVRQCSLDHQTGMKSSILVTNTVRVTFHPWPCCSPYHRGVESSAKGSARACLRAWV